MCLLVLAMILRALIPAGYMPDPAALRDGRVEITFCTMGSGISTATLDLGDHEGNAPHQDGAASDCPFGVLAQQAFDIPLVAAAVMPAMALLAWSAPFALSRALAALPPRGPPLGSRAPPYRLG